LKIAGMKVLGTDLLASRLKLARKYGANRAVLANQLSTPNSQLRIDAAIIAVPSDAVVTQALQLVRGAGKVLLFAHTKRAEVRSQKSEVRKPSFNLQPLTFNLDLASVCLDEKDLVGSYSSDFTLQREVARLVFSRQLDVRSLITHRFPLAETSAAIALAARPTEASLKIVVNVGE